MTKTFCKQYAKSFPGYTCIDEICKGNDCVCKNKEQPSCEDIGCNDQVEGECMTKKNYKQDSKTFQGYTCTDVFFKGNDCDYKYKKQ